MKVYDILSEASEPKQPKTRNPVAHAAQKVAKGSGAHKDRKKAAKQGDVKHKKDIVAEDNRSENENILAKIANAGDAGYDIIYDGLTGKFGSDAQTVLQDMYDQVSINDRLHPDDDFEQIIDRMMDQLESDYGTQGVDEGWQKALTTGLTAASIAAGGALGWMNGDKIHRELQGLEKAHAELVVKNPEKAAELQKAIDRIKITKGNAKLNATTFGNIKRAKELVNEQGVAEDAGEYRTKTMKVFKDRSGKPVGEIGINLDSNPEAQDWYVHHYDTGYNVLGFDNATQAKKELMYVHKHPESVSEQGVAEGEYDPSYDPEYRPYQKPERNVDWDIEAERNRPDDNEPEMIVTVIDDNTNEVVLKFKSTGGYYGDVRHALKHGYDTERGDYRIKWKRTDVKESATAGATSAANVAVGAVYKNKPAKQLKNKDGTAKNALDIKANLMTGGSIKR